MNKGNFANALKPYIGKTVIGVDNSETVSGQLFISLQGIYGIGNPMSPTWDFNPLIIEDVVPVPELDTVVIRI
jgi:hypothetical protein